MAKAKAKSKGKKRKGKHAKLSRGKKKSKAMKAKGRRGGARKAAPKKRRAAPKVPRPQPYPAMAADTTPAVTTFASEAEQEMSIAGESPGPEETSYSEISDTGSKDQSSM